MNSTLRAPRSTAQAACRIAVIAGGVVAVALGSCGGRTPQGPDAVLARYVAAIETDRPDQAYRLLDSALKRKMTREEFATRWRTLKPELARQARQLRRQMGRPAGIGAQLAYPGGTRIDLRFANDSWQIEKPVSVTIKATTPAEALEALIRAMEQRDYQAVMSLLAASTQEDLDKRLDKLRAWLAAGGEIVIKGDRARARYDPRHEVSLVKEDGEWRIVDFE